MSSFLNTSSKSKFISSSSNDLSSSSNSMTTFPFVSIAVLVATSRCASISSSSRIFLLSSLISASFALVAIKAFFIACCISLLFRAAAPSNALVKGVTVTPPCPATMESDGPFDPIKKPVCAWRFALVSAGGVAIVVRDYYRINVWNGCVVVLCDLIVVCGILTFCVVV